MKGAPFGRAVKHVHAFSPLVHVEHGERAVSPDPRVRAAEGDDAHVGMQRPEHLADLEFRLVYFDGDTAMNDWAAAVTRKAIEVSRSRAATPPTSSAPTYADQ